MVGASEASPGHIYKDLPEASGEGLCKPPERGQCKGRRNLKQGRRVGGVKGVPGKGF